MCRRSGACRHTNAVLILFTDFLSDFWLLGQSERLIVQEEQKEVTLQSIETRLMSERERSEVRGQRSEAALTHSQAEEQKGLVRVNAPGLLPQQRRNQTSPGQRGGRGDRAGLCRGSCAGKRKWKEECAENQRRTGDSETPRRKTTAKQSTQTSNGQVTFHPRIKGKRFYIKIICINININFFS